MRETSQIHLKTDDESPASGEGGVERSPTAEGVSSLKELTLESRKKEASKRFYLTRYE